MTACVRWDGPPRSRTACARHLFGRLSDRDDVVAAHMATTDGSSSTTPEPRLKIRVREVPESMARSRRGSGVAVCPNIAKVTSNCARPSYVAPPDGPGALRRFGVVTDREEQSDLTLGRRRRIRAVDDVPAHLGRKIARIEPGVASTGLVAPIMVRHARSPLHPRSPRPPADPT